MKTIQSTPPQAAVIIPAAGTGSRLGAEIPKQFLPIGGKPLLVHTCEQFMSLKEISSLVIVAHPSYVEQTQTILLSHVPKQFHHKFSFTVGGKLRQDSVFAGLQALATSVTLVLVHDAARPFIDNQTICRTIEGAGTLGAVIAAVPVKDTLKQVDDETLIVATVDRSKLWQAQTPQAAQKHLLLHAFEHARRTGFIGTDEASLLEHAGIKVHVVQGDEKNIKITHPGDVDIAEQFMQEQQLMKIGHGYDAHRLTENRDLILGGVTIEYPLGLDGHSDADVVCHALSDAILGAMGAGDIGRHFPDSDPQYKGISSILLLEHVVALAETSNLVLSNADITIVCQQPKLAPHLGAMQDNLAKACRVKPTAINIKATTTEKMGFAGRSEGIATHAVILMRSI